MKYGTALKQSKSSVRFLAVVVPIPWGLFAWGFYVGRPAWGFGALAGFMTLYLIGDLVNIRMITKAAAKDPDHLKKRMP